MALAEQIGMHFQDKRPATEQLTTCFALNRLTSVARRKTIAELPNFSKRAGDIPNSLLKHHFQPGIEAITRRDDEPPEPTAL